MLTLFQAANSIRICNNYDSYCVGTPKLLCLTIEMKSQIIPRCSPGFVLHVAIVKLYVVVHPSKPKRAPSPRLQQARS